MKNPAKLSPALEPYLDQSGPNDKRDAIVILKESDQKKPGPRGRLRELQKRLDQVKAQASTQAKIQAKFQDDYANESRRMSNQNQSMRSTFIGQQALPVASVEISKKTLPALVDHPDVIAIMPNQNIKLLQPKRIDFDTLARQEINSGFTWGLKQLGIPKLWETTQGLDINVAVLDTGVHGDHRSLNERISDFVVIDPQGRRIEASPTFDGGQHGTHVCGTIAGGKTPDGVAFGVAPEAKILAAGVLIGQSSLRTLIEGISWAVEKGADIINMSLGFDYYEPLFDRIFEMLIKTYGILPVVAIGNENHGNTSSPGSSSHALSVGSIEKTGRKIEVSSFSSGASLVFPGESKDLVTKPDVVAPGSQVYSCIPPQDHPTGLYEYTYMDGTSMAAPHVAGVAALLMSAKPDAPVEDIVQAIRETAKHPSGALRPDNRWGYGVIQPEEALKVL